MAPDRQAVALGVKIKELRRERGMDQRGLAKVLKRSVSWVSQVERGEIVVSDVGMLQRLAAALAVPSRELVEMVLGGEAAEVETQRPYVEVLRLALAGHPAPRAALGLGATPTLEVSPEQLAEQVRHAWKLVHASQFDELGPLLAKLIPVLERIGRQSDAAHQTFVLLADAYQIAAAMLVKVGDWGAGWISADRAISAGERCGDPSLVMAAQLRMARTFVGSSDENLALHVLRQAVEVADQLGPDSEPGLLSLTGACALLLAVLEARRGKAADARLHMAVATVLAKKLGSDRNHFGTEFGPTNVAVHAVAVAVEMGNAAEALELAAKVSPSALSPERQARFLVDVARAHAQRRAVAAAVTALTGAQEIAPAEIADSRQVRELLSDLEHLSAGRPIPALRALRRAITHK